MIQIVINAVTSMPTGQIVTISSLVGAVVAIPTTFSLFFMKKNKEKK